LQAIIDGITGSIVILNTTYVIYLLHLIF